MNTNNNKKHKVLIVDDQQKNIQVLGGLLRQENYIIGVATNGKQALETLIEANDYDLVLLDINMPVMDGLEAAKAIRAHENLKETPIIFLTANVEIESIVEGFDAGGQDYVTKPFNSRELLARVKTHLDLKQSKEELKEINSHLEDLVAQRTQELADANEELTQLDTAKNEFLRLIQHEIRTPLNGIMGGLSIIKEYSLPDEVQDFIEMLDTSSSRLEQFSYKALDISSLRTKGKDAIKKQPTDINALLNTVMEQLQYLLDEKKVSLSIQPVSVKDIEIDEKKFLNALRYVVENAIQFSANGMTVEIICDENENEFIFQVIDYGPGFSDYALDNLFQPFSNTKFHVDENVGLSLYYTKLVIDAHLGSIKIEPNKPKGTVVTINLPHS